MSDITASVVDEQVEALRKFFLNLGLHGDTAQQIASTLVHDHKISSESMVLLAHQDGDLKNLLESIGITRREVKYLGQQLNGILRISVPFTDSTESQSQVPIDGQSNQDERIGN